MPHTHSFATSDAGHAQLPHQVLPDGYVMTDDGYVFPVEMSPQEMERCKKSMILTGSVFTKHEPLYELGDGAPMFTFLVKKPEPSPGARGMGSVDTEVKLEMENDDYRMTQPEPPEFPVPGGQAPGGCRAERKKKRTTTSGGSTVSGKATLTKSRKSSGVGIAKALEFSGQRPTFVVARRVRALKVLTTARRTAS